MVKIKQLVLLKQSWFAFCLINYRLWIIFCVSEEFEIVGDREYRLPENRHFITFYLFAFGSEEY